MKSFKSHRLCKSLGSAILACAVTLYGTVSFGQNGLTVGTSTALDGDTADIALLVSADDDVQGVVLVFDWDGSLATGLDLLAADGAGMALENAELVQTRVEDDFMIFAVIMDLDGQGGEMIPTGQDTGEGVEIATARIRCDGPPTNINEIALVLADGKYAVVDGGPLLSNNITVGGRSIGADEGLSLDNGALSCQGEGPKETICDNNVDDDDDGDTDCDDSDCRNNDPVCQDPGGDDIVFACGGDLGEDGNPEDEMKGAVESTPTVTFYYRSDEDLQGLSMSVSYHCDLHAIEDSFDISGGALEDAEFVFLEVDNLGPGSDDDNCGFTLGVLVDATAPFDGRKLPKTGSFQELFTLDFLIENDADCGDCMWVKFMDGKNGAGDVAVKNLVSVDFFSQAPDELRNCAICVEGGRSLFIRGNCNFADQGTTSVDIADPAAMVGFIFLNQFDAPCEDACDANDDGLLDAGDIVFILNYLFVGGSPHPPAPGPRQPGTDESADSLGCAAGESEC